MSLTLTQSTDAAFPDRPLDAPRQGLLLAASQGVDGSYLEHEFAVEIASFHTRLLLNPGTLAGGSTTIIRGHDAAEGETFSISYDAITRGIDVLVATGDLLRASLPSGLNWHCIEVRIDSTSGEAELWINGVLADSFIGNLSSLATKTFWIGGIAKHPAVAGNLHLDEWVIADAYIGPVVESPNSEFAEDPKRWLVVYNTNDPESVAWAQAYVDARSVPFANLCGLALSSSESIDQPTFASLSAAISQYVELNGLTNQVVGVLLGFGVPGYVDFGDTVQPVASLLHNDAPTSGGVENPLASDGPTTQRPTLTSLGGLRLTARIDGEKLADALAMIARATNLIDNGITEATKAAIFLDPYNAPTQSTASMLDWAASLGRMETRLPLRLSAEVDPGGEVDFAVVEDDAFVWAWSAPNPPAGFFDANAGPRVAAVQVNNSSASGATLRDEAPGNWMQSALSAGYAAAIGTSEAYSADSIPFVRPFIDALRRGWTLAEAWFVACPVVRDGLFLAGDPLLQVAFPKAGWNVFGPMDRLEQLDASSPNFMLREGENHLALDGSDQPDLDHQAVYLIRHVDESGRGETGTRSVRTAHVGGKAVSPPLQPVWPDVHDWMPRFEMGLTQFHICWDRPITQARVDSIELIAESQAGSEQSIATFTPSGLGTHIEHAHPASTESTRYCWRIHGQGVAIHTPWSRYVRPAGQSPIDLQLLETS